MQISIDAANRIYVLWSDNTGPYTVLHPDGSTTVSFTARRAWPVYDEDGGPDESSEDYNAGYDDGYDAAQKALAAARKPTTATTTGARL